MQTTIYIRKDNEDRWNAIADKSAWVNDLLSKTAPRAQEPDHQLERRPGEVGDTPAAIRKIKEDARIQLVTDAFEGKPTLYCKNGHVIPSGRDRCLTKGCKFS